MKELSKQDKNGVRQASEVARRYGLGEIKTQIKEIQNTNVISSISSSSNSPISSSAVYQALKGKVDKEDGKGLSSNDYTDAEKTKLAGIEEGAEKNDSNTVIDSKYVHTDNNLTDELVTKINREYQQTNELITLKSGTTIINEQELEFTSSYIVGDNSLEIYWNRMKLIKDIDYTEVGEDGDSSNIITLYKTEDETLTETVYVEVIVRKFIEEEENNV